MKKLRGGIAVGLGSTVAVLGITALSATSAFAMTPPTTSPSTYPVPNVVHFEITKISTPSTAIGGGNLAVTVSVYEANPDNIGTGSSAYAETGHSLPAAFPFSLTVGGTTQQVYGVMSNQHDPSALDPQTTATGDMWTYTYMVPTPAVTNDTNFTISGGSGMVPATTTESELSNYPPFMIHDNAVTYSYYSNGKPIINQDPDTDDPIYGTMSATGTLTPPPTGILPEVPYAGVFPALFAAGAVAFYLRKRRRTN